MYKYFVFGSGRNNSNSDDCTNSISSIMYLKLFGHRNDKYDLHFFLAPAKNLENETSKL